MLLNNGKAFLYFSDYGLDDDGNLIWNPQYELLRTNGLAAIVERYTDKQPEGMNYSYLAGSLELIVGSGNTTPVVTDYRLENEIVDSELAVLSKDSENLHNLITKTYNDNYPIIEVTKTYKNNSLTESFTVNEVGIIAKDKYGFSYLFIREVLEEPYIIAPQETATFTLTLDYAGEGSSTTWSKYFAYQFKHCLCPSNYVNGKNHANSIERPLIAGIGRYTTGTSSSISTNNLKIYRGGIPWTEPQYVTQATDLRVNTFWLSRNMLCAVGTQTDGYPTSYGIFDSNNNGHFCGYNRTSFNWSNMIIKSSLNNNNEFISYLNPIIVHTCTTVINRDNSNKTVVSLGIETSMSKATPASYFLNNDCKYHNIYSNYNILYGEGESQNIATVIPFAKYDLASEDQVTVAPGEMATFTFIIG